MNIRHIDNIVMVCCKNDIQDSAHNLTAEALVHDKLKKEFSDRLFKPLHQLHEHCPTDSAKFHYYFEDITHKHSLCS